MTRKLTYMEVRDVKQLLAIINQCGKKLTETTQSQNLIQADNKNVIVVESAVKFMIKRIGIQGILTAFEVSNRSSQFSPRLTNFL